MVVTTGDPAKAALRAIEAELSVVQGDAGRVRCACRALAPLAELAPGRSEVALERLGAALAARRGPAATALFDFLEESAEEAAGAGRPEIAGRIAVQLLRAADAGARGRALELVARRAEAGALVPDGALVERLADLAEGARGTGEAAALEAAARVLPRMGGAGADPLVGLLDARVSGPVRRLAARVLDRGGRAVPAETAQLLLGGVAYSFLSHHLAYTRATHLDLVALTPEAGAGVPALEPLRAAEAVLGREALGRAIAELGWGRVARGVEVEAVVAVQTASGPPLVVRPAEARLLEAAGAGRRAWEGHVVVAHGSAEAGGTERPVAHREDVQRFRAYNVAHAELLAEILEVAPVTRAKVRRIIGLLDGVVRDYEALFSGHDEEAARVEAVYGALRERVLAEAGAGAEDEPLPAQATRLVQMFEDPASLEQVRTLHGLKRYLHQRGLRNAFRLFRSGGAANRTVDLLVLRGERPAAPLRRIRYIEFEPEAGERELPLAVQLVMDAFRRQLLHGGTELPEVRILCYGTEVQLYVQYRNHPAFVRLDLSPPRRGGMIDLEYYAVSQYELAQHPDPEIPAIRLFLRRLGFHVDVEGVRLHARYDKEAAFDLADLLEKAAGLLRLLPHLMALDWTIGSLDYPPAVRRRVAEAWAERFLASGVLPVESLLTADRRRVVERVERDALGERTIEWDGRGEYRDRYGTFTGAFTFTGAEYVARVRAEMERRGLGHVARWEEVREECAQLALERGVLEPLRAALARGEVEEEAGELRAAPPERFRREHEADRFAELLARPAEAPEVAGVPGGAGTAGVTGPASAAGALAGPSAAGALASAARLAAWLRPLERQLRFTVTGSVNGHAVERAWLPLRSGTLAVFVLRDDDGVARLALAAPGGVLHRVPGADGGWRACGTVDPQELVKRLLRDNYLAPGAELGVPGGEDLAALRARLLVPGARGAAGPVPGDRVVRGVAAAPGRAAGFARIGGAGRSGVPLEDAVLIAPAVRPEDAPQLRRAAAVVSTGGGILSHMGLIALELGKPSVIVAGRWREEGGRPAELLVRCTEYRETVHETAGFTVTRREDFREHEESVRDGDLVVVDADAGTLRLLGRDRDALALHRELRLLARTSRALAETADEATALALRGRLLGAMHQLEKLLARIDWPALAQHAVAELFSDDFAAAGRAGAAERCRLLARLARNPALADSAHAARERCTAELQHRLGRLSDELRAALPSLESPLEILHLRLAVVRARERLRELADECGPAAAVPAPEDEAAALALDALVAGRLGEIRASAVRQATSLAPADRWMLRHLLARIGWIDAVLPPPGDAADLAALARQNAAADADALERLAGRAILFPADGGSELAPLAGFKAANLGEIVRALSPACVPAWFTIADAALRRVLDMPLRAHAGAAPPRRSLGDAIEAALAECAGDPARAAESIRSLWRAAELPVDLEAAIVEAYRALGAGPEDAAPCVAIRSSTFEEDAPAATWAGQFDTFLFVRGERAVLEHVKRVWAGLWSERALHRRLVDGVRPGAAGGGVIVQRMADARVSGVLHTVGVAAGRAREMVINAGLGLGEGVVSGVVDVDEIRVAKEMEDGAPLRLSYVVGDKRERVVHDAERGSGTRREETLFHQRLRPALEYTEVCELVHAAARLEAIRGQPLDLEFAFEGTMLRILQLRPIPLFRGALAATSGRARLRTPDTDAIPNPEPEETP